MNSAATYLLVVGELDGLDLLRAVLVVVEVVLHGERLHQLHGRLRANLTYNNNNILLKYNIILI